MSATEVAPGAGSMFRLQRWWAPKLLPIVAAGELAALTAGVPAGAGLAHLTATLASALGVGALAHVLNDLGDRDSDRVAGVPNAWQGAPPALVAAVLVLGAAVAVVPWVLVDLDPAALVLLVALSALSVAYSLPPLRLKARGLAGAASDAAVVHVLPTAFAFVQVGSAGTRDRWWWAALVGALCWSAGFGFRSIVVHQVLDLEGDRRAGLRTYVARRGVPGAVRAARDAVGPELAGLAVLAVVAAQVAWGTAVFFAVHLGLWLHHRRFDRTPVDTVPVEPGAWVPLAEFYVVWPALVFGVALTAREPLWWLLPAAIVVLFWSAVRKQVADELALVAELAGEVGRAGGTGLRRYVVSPLADRAWPAVRSSAARCWWALYRAHWRFRHAVVDRIVAYWRRQGRRARRRLRGPTPPH